MTRPAARPAARPGPRRGLVRQLRVAAALAAAACGDVAGPRAGGGPTGGPGGAPADAAHPGFDIAVHPGDAALRAWRAASPYAWTGYYLSAPCHRDASFLGRRAALDAIGFGAAVLYVGQQTWEGVAAASPADEATVDTTAPPDAPGAARAPARALARAPIAAPATARTARLWAQAQPAAPAPTGEHAQGRPALAAPTCSRTLLSAAQGAAEGADAAASTAAEGFARGTTVFLDLEPMTVVPEAMRAYYRAWARAVLADGRFRPGVYVHHGNAAAVHADVRAVYAEFGAAGVPVWVARSAGFALDRHPSESGFAFAAVWQGALDVRRTWGGVTLTVDENVAAAPSPSAP